MSNHAYICVWLGNSIKHNEYINLTSIIASVQTDKEILQFLCLKQQEGDNITKRQMYNSYKLENLDSKLNSCKSANQKKNWIWERKKETATNKIELCNCEINLNLICVTVCIKEIFLVYLPQIGAESSTKSIKEIID